MRTGSSEEETSMMLNERYLVLEIGTELENLKKIVCVCGWAGVDPICMYECA